MATDLQTRPDEDQDRIQEHYDEQFGAITSAEHQAKSGIPGDVGDGSESGFFRNEGDDASSKSSTTGKDQKASAPGLSENEGGLYNSEDGANGKRGRFFNLKNRKKSITASILGLGFGGGGLILISISSGPLQVMHYGSLLAKPQSSQQNAVESRITRGIRWAKTGNIGETRLGFVGTRINAQAAADFAKRGIEFKADKFTGQIRGVTVNLKNNPTYSGLSNDEAIKQFAEDNGLPPSSVVSGGGKLTADLTGKSISAKRGIIKATVAEENLGKIASAMRMRALANYYDAPGWWHPLRKAAIRGDQAIAEAVQAKKQTKQEKANAEEKERVKKLAEKSPEAKAINDSLKGKIKPGVASTLGYSLIVTAGLCIAKDVADRVPEINKVNVVIPAVQSAGDAISLASQLESGEDFDLDQAGAVIDNFEGKDGSTPWQSEGMQKLENPNSTGGKPIDPALGQAFSSESSTKNVQKTLDAFGADKLCSTVGKVVQFVGGAVLILTGAGGPIQKALQAGIAVGVSIGIGHLTEQLAQMIADDPVTKTAHNGSFGGNLDAYASLYLASSNARLQGGTEMTAAETKQVTAAQSADDAQDFASKGVIGRVFDTHDYRSLASKVIDSQNPSAVANVGSVLNSTLTSIGNLGSMFSNLASAFTPKASAANTNGGWYNLGYDIKQYGFSEADLNDAKIQNPYENADKVAEFVNAAGIDHYNDRLKNCFGVQLSYASDNKLTVTTLDDQLGGPYPAEESYQNSNCGDKSEDWLRLRFFVLDVGSLTAYACYQGDDQSCIDLGVGTTSPAAAEGAGTKLKIATFNVRGASHPEKGSVDYRAKGGAKFINDNHFQVVGLQELQTTQGQRDAYVKYLGTKWDFWPAKHAKNVHHSVENSIAWDTTYYTSVDSGIVTGKYHYFNGEALNIPWVKLQDNSTGQQFVVESTHDPTDLDGNFDLIRSANADQHLIDAQNWAHQGLPVFIVGDFNSTFYLRTAGNGAKDDLITRDRLPYCIMTKTGELLNAFDVVRKTGNPVGKNCPTGHTKEVSDLAAKYGNLIDHIYVTPQVQVSSLQWSTEPEDANPRYTDHPVMWADAVIPGTGVSGKSFVAATYNIEHLVSFPDAGCILKTEKKVSGPYEHGYIRPACIDRKTTNDTKIIMGASPATNPKLDIVGLQEVSRPQYTNLKQKLSGYDAVPTLANLPKAHGTAIFWDSSKFSKVSEGTMNTYSNSAGRIDLPWVQLKAAVGTIYVLSVHAPNNDNGGSVAIRAKMADEILAWAKTKKAPDTTVLIMGDFNTGKDSPNQVYCHLTADTLVNLADFVKNLTVNKACPYPGDEHRSDQVYIGPIPGTTASGWAHAPESGIYANTSDHEPVYAKVSLPGSN